MSLNKLQLARNLVLPSREAMLHRAPSVQRFWDDSSAILRHAWQEWEEAEKANLASLDSSLMDSKLARAVSQAWADPSKEFVVQNLLHEVTPGVFQLQLFNPDRLADLRAYLESVWNAQIPIRPPYGIVLNRRGAMLDQRSEGYLAAPSFQVFYRDLIDTYMRPIGRLLFPEILGYDNQSFGFSIHYRPDTDNSIRPHTDASAVTLNINLNLPGETFSGSAVDFFDPTTEAMKGVAFTPGSAMIHRGNLVHAAQPIISGERTNLVLWLYGEQGSVPPQEIECITIPPEQRWKLPAEKQDWFAPF